jgi:hypothetical protein
MKLQQDQLPLYYEGLQFRRRLVLAGWPLALAVAGLGVVLVGTSAQPLVDASGLVVGVLGAVLIAGLVRCRRCEIVISGRAVTSTVGPLRRRAPVEWLERGELRRSRSWRRLFADRELVFELPDHGPSFILPTAEPEALKQALREAKSADRREPSG